MGKSGRRSNGEGSISLNKQGLWIGQITLFIDEKGKQVRKCVSGKTKRIVSDKLSELIVEKAKNTITQNDKITVQDWIVKWMDIYKSRTLKKKTIENYNSAANNYIIPNIGNIQLQKLTALDIQGLINKLIDKQIAPSTIKYMFTVLSASINQAIRNNLVSKNPCADVKTPKISRNAIKTFSVEELKQFLAQAKEHYLYPSFLILATTGIRRGECLALKWKDINFDTGILTISTQIIESRTYGNIIDTPKTECSIRKIPISSVIIDILSQYKKDNNDWIAGTKNKTFVSPRNFNRAYYMLLERAGLNHLKLHGIRHSVATLLIEGNVDLKSVSLLLGHSTEGFTARTYIHPSQSMKKNAMDKISDLLIK